MYKINFDFAIKTFTIYLIYKYIHLCRNYLYHKNYKVNMKNTNTNYNAVLDSKTFKDLRIGVTPFKVFNLQFYLERFWKK